MFGLGTIINTAAIPAAADGQRAISMQMIYSAFSLAAVWAAMSIPRPDVKPMTALI